MMTGGGVMELLLDEYQQSLKAVKKKRESAPEEDQKIYAGMVGNLEYIVKWLRDGQQPLPAKNRTVEWDPEWESFSDYHADPYSSDMFNEIDSRIDMERRRERTGTNSRNH